MIASKTEEQTTVVTLTLEMSEEEYKDLLSLSMVDDNDIKSDALGPYYLGWRAKALRAAVALEQALGQAAT